MILFKLILLSFTVLVSGHNLEKKDGDLLLSLDLEGMIEIGGKPVDEVPELTSAQAFDLCSVVEDSGIENTQAFLWAKNNHHVSSHDDGSLKKSLTNGTVYGPGCYSFRWRRCGNV